MWTGPLRCCRRRTDRAGRVRRPGQKRFRRQSGSRRPTPPFLPKLDVLLRGKAGTEPDPQRVALPGGIDRQQKIGGASARILEDVAMDIEVQRIQRGAAARRVRVGDGKVGAKPDKSAHLARASFKHRGVKIMGGDAALIRRTKRFVDESDRFGQLPGGSKCGR